MTSLGSLLYRRFVRSAGPSHHRSAIRPLRGVLAIVGVLLLAAPAAGADGTLRVPMTLKQVSAGSNHTCAIKTIDSAPVCWGLNDDGQTTIPADTGTVKQITAGGYHTCAI